MPKPNPLMQGLEQQTSLAKKKQILAEPEETNSQKRPPSRQGKVLISGFFAPEVQENLKIIAAKERTTVQGLLSEGINAVLAKRGAPQIASLAVK